MDDTTTQSTTSQRECNACEWHGVTDRMLGTVGPLCPLCGETTELSSTVYELQIKFEALLEDNTAMPRHLRMQLATVMVTFAQVHLSKPLVPIAAVLSMPDAVRDVLAERRRQVEVEGCTPEHDDKNTSDEMAQAAACYAMNKKLSFGDWHVWPWAHSWWKPANKRRNLVKAAALLVAEIERVDRAAASNAGASKNQ